MNILRDIGEWFRSAFEWFVEVVVEGIFGSIIESLFDGISNSFGDD